jgi:hypothetical protein
MSPAFLALLHWLNQLQAANGQCSAWNGDAANYTHVVYQGSCIQAWLLSVQSHGTVFWGFITG